MDLWRRETHVWNQTGRGLFRLTTHLCDAPAPPPQHPPIHTGVWAARHVERHDAGRERGGGPEDPGGAFVILDTLEFYVCMMCACGLFRSVHAAIPHLPTQVTITKNDAGAGLDGRPHPEQEALLLRRQGLRPPRQDHLPVRSRICCVDGAVGVHGLGHGWTMGGSIKPWVDLTLFTHTRVSHLVPFHDDADPPASLSSHPPGTSP